MLMGHQLILMVDYIKYMRKMLTKVNRKKINSGVKNFSFYFLTTIINTILMIIINPFMAKNLSHEDYAIMGYHNSFQILLLPLLNFALTSYYLRHYYLTPKSERDVLRDTINKMIVIWGLFSMFVCYFGFYIFFKIRNIDIPFFPYFIFSILTVYANNFIVMQQIEYRLTRKSKNFFFLTIGLRLMIIFFSVVLVVFIPLGAIGRMLAGSGCTLVYGLFCYKKMNSGHRIDYEIVKKAIVFCWPLALSALLWYFISGVDKVFLEQLKDTNSFALYNIAAGLSGKLTLFYVALAQTIEPDIYRSLAAKKYRKVVYIALGVILLNAIPNLIFILVAKPIIHVYTGGRYTDAFVFAQILVLTNIARSFYNIGITIIVGLGFTKSELFNRLIGAIISVFMYKYLIENFGYVGAAWGHSLSLIIMTIISVIFIFLNKNKMLAHNK